MSSEFRDAIYSQPRNLLGAREAFQEAVTELPLETFRTGTLVMSGIGASAHALTPAVLTLRAAGRRAFAVAPSELADPRAAELADAFVLVSQSGASTETLHALAHLDGAPIVAISAHAESPLVDAAGSWLPLGPFEDTEVATLSYTATLQALGLLCDALLGTSSGWHELPELAMDVLERSDPVTAQAAESFAAVAAIDAVGGGTAQASAGETALLAREGLRLPATGMETREYLHGPLEAVGEGFGCVLFGGERESELADELAGFGASTMLIGDEPRASDPAVHAVDLPRIRALAAPVLQILPVQLLADHIARLRRFEIGKLRRRQPDTKVA